MKEAKYGEFYLFSHFQGGCLLDECSVTLCDMSGAALKFRFQGGKGSKQPNWGPKFEFYLAHGGKMPEIQGAIAPVAPPMHVEIVSALTFQNRFKKSPKTAGSTPNHKQYFS